MEEKKMYIKGFDKYLKCKNFQFEIGKEYNIESSGKALSCCSDTVFHFCDSLQNVHKFYSADDKKCNRFCEIEVLGQLVHDGIKLGSNHIRIIREIVGEELDIIKGKVNGNTGVFNSGSSNSGNHNPGDYNTGDYNSGDRNSGDYNTGNRNSGDRNSGYYNSGNRNSGHYNYGNSNSGDWNSCDGASGVFNTEDSTIKMFNKQSSMTLTEWRKSDACRILYNMPVAIKTTKWVLEKDMNDKEKDMYSSYKTCGGYIKEYMQKVDVQGWWNNLNQKEKDCIMALENFDEDIFKKITGIDVSNNA